MSTTFRSVTFDFAERSWGEHYLLAWRQHHGHPAIPAGLPHGERLPETLELLPTQRWLQISGDATKRNKTYTEGQGSQAEIA